MSDYDDNTEPAGASTSETIPSFPVTPGLPIGGAGNAARADGGYSLGRTPNMHIPIRPNGAGGAAGAAGAAGGDSIYAAGRTPVVSIAPRPGEMTEFGGNGGHGSGSGSASGTRPGSSSELGAFGSAMRWQNAMSGASTTSVYDDDDMSDDGHSHATLNTSPEAFDNSKMMQTSGGDAPQLRQHELTTNPLRENIGNGVEWRKDMLDVSLRPPPTDDEETLNTRTKDWGWGQFFLALAVLAISSVVLFCNTVSKLSLSAMINQYRLMEGNSETTDIERHVAFLMLLLVIMLPQGVGFIISLWNSCYKASARNPSPSGRALLWILFQSLAESVGICLFVLYVGVRIDPLFCIVMMNGTFSVPSFARLRRLQRQRKGYEQVPLMSAINGSRQSVINPPRKPSVWDKVLYAGSSVLQVVALGFIPIYLWRQGMTVDVCILSAVSMFLLSTAWLPDLQYKMMEPTKARYDMDSDQFHPSRRTEDALKTRTKTAIYACFGRILFTVIFATVYFKLDKRLGKIGVADMFANLSNSPLFTPFLIQLFTSFFGYHAARCACMMSVQVTGFALPLYLATPLTLAIALTTCSNFPFHLDWACTGTVQTMWLIIIGAALWFSEIMLTLKTAWNRSTPRVALDESLFFQPSYNGVFLEQFTILNRRPPDQGPKVLTAEEEFERSKIYICTTMYREARDEMKNTVGSLLEMDRAMNEMCESHIIMDGGAQGGTLGKFAIQLVTVLKECLMEKFHEQKGTYALKDPLDMENWLAENGQRIETPYGLRLEFKLPYGMFMIMHLKDPSRVKKKKRWSQVLYMYYFLQFRAPSHIPHDQAAYILTTDADIKFRPQDVTALLALLTRDHRVGAVCGRTFPIGEGPLYWYQIFDYAVGHWFQKTAEHVLGSVLCCPGCFSMFRCDALRDTLKEYSTEVNEAVEFLTKDMGEDRWLCTLLVLAGWRLDYTAVAYDETHCPTSFDEFFNQRRRWIPSTLANILQLIKKWRIATRNNDSMSSFFMFYQCAMLFSSMVSPATVLLVIMGGLHYANTFSLDWIFGWLCGLVGIFVVACLFASQNVQLWLAKLFTLIFALVMGAVTVGVAAEIGSEFHKQSTPDSGEPTSVAPHTTTPPRRVDGDLSNFTTAAMTTLINNGTTIATTTSSFISEVLTTLSPQHMLGDGLDGFNGYQVSVSTVYLGAIIGMFLIAGLFHPDEAKALLHGVWYLLCLPGGYLFLLIYAFANLNDRSWGTREEANQQKLQGSWIDEVMRGCGRHPDENIYHFIGRLLCCRASLPPPAKPVVPHPYSLLSDAREDDRVRPWELAEDGSKATCRPVEEMLAMIDKNQPGGDTDDQMRIFNRKTAQALEACPSLNTIAHCKFLARWDVKSKQFTSNVLRDAAFLTSIKDEVRAHFQARYSFNKAFGHPVMELGDNVQTTEDFLKRNKIDDPYVAQQFKEHGYDDTTFLVGVKMDDLKSIGVTNMLVSRQMTKKLLDAMGKLNNTGIPDTIPVTIDEWLISLHLDCYHFNFLTLGYQDTEIALLEGLTTPDLHQLGIKKRAHVKKLSDALRKLSKLRDQGRSPEGPSKDAVEEAHTRELVARLETKPLGQSYLVKRHLIQDEQGFWQQMVAERIGAKLENTSNITEMREGLLALRNAAVLVLFVINALWVVLMVELTSSQASSLNIIGTNPLGFFFLVVYGGIFFIQFLTLLWHRGATVTQALAHVHFPPKSDDEVTRLRQSFPV